MTIGSEMPPAPAPWRRRKVLLVVVLAAIAALVSAVLVLGGGPDPQAGASPTEGGSAEATSPALVPPADPAAPPVSADELPAALPAVALDEPVTVEQVTASLVSIEPIEAEATGPGSVRGPALRVTVRISNGEGTDLPLDGVSVNLSFGADQVPASPVEDPSRRLFGGTLAPGQAADGVYVFAVPVESRDNVNVQVGYRPGAPIAVFTGPAD